MTNTYTPSGYDVFHEEDYDNFGSRRRRLKALRRRKRLNIYDKTITPILWNPPVYRKPKRPINRPLIKIRKTPRVIKVRPKSTPRVNPRVIKKGTIPIKIKSKVNPKILVKPTPKTSIKKPLSKTSKADVRILKAAEIRPCKETKKSNKLIKGIVVVSVLGATGFGIYKFIQKKKLKHGHTRTSKRS